MEFQGHSLGLSASYPLYTFLFTTELVLLSIQLSLTGLAFPGMASHVYLGPFVFSAHCVVSIHAASSDAVRVVCEGSVALLHKPRMSWVGKANVQQCVWITRVPICVLSNKF